MEKSPLNEAHYHHRRAEAVLRHRKYDDAIKHHRIAARLLQSALNSATSPKAAESVRLQREYHLRQTVIVAAKKSHEEDVRRRLLERLDSAKRRDDHPKPPCAMEPNRDASPQSIKMAVNKTMDDADSLLLFLVKRHNAEHGPDSADPNKNEHEVACKEPKDETTVIEELQTVNHQLRTFITELCQQLEEVQQENALLKNKLKAFTQEDTTVEETPTIPVAEKERPHTDTTETPLEVYTGSTDENLSPFVFSPSSDFSPDDTYTSDIKELPPLELPEFDFEEMMKQLNATREANKNIMRKKDY